jgi:hypothetical protein
LGGDTPLVEFEAVGAAREEELPVEFVGVLFETSLEYTVRFVALLSFERMSDFPAVDSRDKSVCDSLHRLVEVGLCGEDIDRGLRRYRGVVGSEGGDVGGAGGNWVERDRKTGRGWWRRGGRLIGQIGRGHGHSVVKEGEGWIDGVVEICVGMVELQSEVGDGE